MLIIPINSRLHSQLETLAKEKRMIMLAGLLGTGKSLLIQQLTMIAHNLGRKVHLLQYDVARQAFETAEMLEKYPEQDGFTDPAIRKALGFWVRDAVADWQKQYPEEEHLLIGELPLIGNRLIELAEVQDDALEAELSKASTSFVIPVPSWEVREVIQENRIASLAKPQNELEKHDAPPNVMEALWQEVNTLARDIGLTKTRPDTPYNPYIYGGVYEALLQHRHSQTLLLTEIYEPMTSVYEIYESNIIVSDLAANVEQVAAYRAQVEEIDRDVLLAQVNNWHKSISENPKLPDRGPELRIPLPEVLTGEEIELELSAAQSLSIEAILTAPLDVDTDALIPLLNTAIDSFVDKSETVIADVHKFDVYDGYFNVSRTDTPITYLSGILEAYRNLLDNLSKNNHELTVIELPLLRVGFETSLRQFITHTEAGVAA